MNISRFCIVRPVATLVMMALLMVFGFISLQRLAVREYPDIDIPTVTVTTTYSGASASVVESKITQRIEDAVAGIDGLETIESTSSDGQSRVMLEFAVSRDIDAASNDVRDRVSRVLSRLPDEADSPVVAKYDSSGMATMIIGVTSTAMNRMELTDYLDRYVTDRFSVIDGVASVDIFGAQEQAMRIWLDPRAMAARGITVEDVESALNAENVEYPAGRIESTGREFTVRVSRQYFTPDDFGSLAIRRDVNGDLIRIRDVATVSLESRRNRQYFEINGEPMVGLAVYKQSKANTLIVSQGARALVEALKATLPPGMNMLIRRDEALFINASIAEVKESLLIAAALVLLIVFLFLGTLKASLIPAMTVPISLISSYTVLYLCGFSLNLLTLLALVLAIGMVVDDAIVVLENVHRRIREGETPLLAAARGSKQVFLAIVATTAVLVAVFMPLSLWEGKTGKMFTEFAVAMTAAVCFSSVVALTLTPLMCARMLKPDTENGRLGRAVDWAMARLEAGYRALLTAVAQVKILTLLLFAAIAIGVVWGWRILPEEYEPTEDRGMFSISVTAPEGTGFYAMNDLMPPILSLFKNSPDAGDLKSILMILPSWGNTDGPVNTARLILDFKLWDERTRTTPAIANDLRPALAAFPGARVVPNLPTGIGSRGQPVQFVIGGPDYADLVQWRDHLLEKARAYPGFVDVDYDYKETTPQFHVSVDTDRAAELGVSAAAVGTALETLLGSKQVTTFVDRGQEYDVMLQAAQTSRASLMDLGNIYVRSQLSPTPIPLDNLVAVTERGDSARLNRYNRVRAITLTGNVAPGYSLGQVLAFLERTVREDLPPEVQTACKGQSKDLRESSGSMLFVFALALLISYLVLAAQFESFISPLIVMMTVPLGMAGALAGLWFTGSTMNIYSQIGIIMLIGLAAKNGILIVEFANQLRDEGRPFYDALIDASCMRLRPILMTGISTVAGAIPLLLASGAGAASRQCLGAVVVYGGLSACLLTLFVVPVAYLALARRQKPPHALQQQLEAEERNHATH